GLPETHGVTAPCERGRPFRLGNAGIAARGPVYQDVIVLPDLCPSDRTLRMSITTKPPATEAITTAPEPSGWGSLRLLNRYQWFAFAAAAIAWMADCLDQQLFNLARVMSLTDLLGGSAANPDDVKLWAGRATSVFLIGWATGGLVFGMFGDRLGRVRTL